MTMESTLGIEPDRRDIAEDAEELAEEAAEAVLLHDDADPPCFEVVHTGVATWHARFVARNNEVVWVTESYRRRREAVAAITMLNARLHPIRDIDERE